MPQLDALDAAIAALQTELNGLDRRHAHHHHIGSMEDLQVLRLLFADGPQRVGEIAARQAASKATVSARLDRLERRGLLVRERVENDRRAVVCALTDEGRRIAKASRRDRRRLFADLADSTTADTFNAVSAALRKAGESPPPTTAFSSPSSR